jgi:hypothetical protein
MKPQAQLEFPQFKGEALTQLPDDLFIPPEALEIFLEDFSGPMDVLLYFNTKERTLIFWIWTFPRLQISTFNILN